jgi:hypothetical protein
MLAVLPSALLDTRSIWPLESTTALAATLAAVSLSLMMPASSEAVTAAEFAATPLTSA